MWPEYALVTLSLQSYCNWDVLQARIREERACRKMAKFLRCRTQF